MNLIKRIIRSYQNEKMMKQFEWKCRECGNKCNVRMERCDKCFDELKIDNHSCVQDYDILTNNWLPCRVCRTLKV